MVKDFAELQPIYCAPGQLNQAFMHLLKNAIQAMDGHGKVTIHTFADNGAICIRIRDTGKGIESEQLERIFDFSFKATDERMKMGFGLSTVYNIIQEHQGEITIDSEVGKGTTVALRLPAKQSG